MRPRSRQSRVAGCRSDVGAAPGVISGPRTWPCYDDLLRRLSTTTQYDGWLGSIWSTQATTPPPTCTASEKPAPLAIASTSAERTPDLQWNTNCLSCGNFSSATPVWKSAFGISTEPGIRLISYSFGSRTSISTKSFSPWSLSLIHSLSCFTDTVDPTAASAASSVRAPQKLS